MQSSTWNKFIVAVDLLKFWWVYSVLMEFVPDQLSAVLQATPHVGVIWQKCDDLLELGRIFARVFMEL